LRFWLLWGYSLGSVALLALLLHLSLIGEEDDSSFFFVWGSTFLGAIVLTLVVSKIWPRLIVAVTGGIRLAGLRPQGIFIGLIIPTWFLLVSLVSLVVQGIVR
jgi:hypothetical protein